MAFSQWFYEQWWPFLQTKDIYIDLVKMVSRGAWASEKDGNEELELGSQQMDIREQERRRGRMVQRWRHDLEARAGSRWMRMVREMERWGGWGAGLLAVARMGDENELLNKKYISKGRRTELRRTKIGKRVRGFNQKNLHWFHKFPFMID